MIRAVEESFGRHIRLTENEYGQADGQTFFVPWELWAATPKDERRDQDGWDDIDRCRSFVDVMLDH